jgi:hypothetical protein
LFSYLQLPVWKFMLSNTKLDTPQQNRQPQQKPKSSYHANSQSTSTCKYCGRKHEYNKTKCPTFGKECRKCGKPNHLGYNVTGCSTIQLKSSHTGVFVLSYDVHSSKYMSAMSAFNRVYICKCHCVYFKVIIVFVIRFIR